MTRGRFLLTIAFASLPRYGNFVGLRTSFLRAPAVRAVNRYLYENFTNFYGVDQMAVIGMLCMFVDMPGLGLEPPEAPLCDLLAWRAAADNGIFSHP